MPVELQTQINENGSITVNQVDTEKNKVEIYDSRDRLRVELTDITDLRDAKSEAKSGETVRVNQGEYITRNLLKDGVDWHFLDGAVVKNPRDETGAIFENVGAHGSPGGNVVSNITGNGKFVFRKEDSESGNAVVNVGRSSTPDTEIYFEAKEVEIPSEEDGQCLLMSNGKVEMDIDIFKAPKNNPDTGSVNALVNTVADISNSTESEVLVDCDVVDLRGSDSHGNIYSGGGSYRGKVEISVGTLKTDDGSGSWIAGVNENTPEGYVRISVEKHEGSVDYGVLPFNGGKPIYLENFEFNNSDGADDSAAVLFYGDFTNVNLKNCIFRDDGFLDSVGNYTIGGAAGFGVSSAEVTNLGSVATNGAVDTSAVTVNGESIVTVSNLDFI